MIILLQRVKNASVKVNEKTIAEINRGIVVFVGIEKGDSQRDIDYLVNKIINLRIFEDNNAKMNLSVKDVNGEIMVVSEFTLAGNCKKGNRPSFERAMPPKEAEKIYKDFIDTLRKTGISVKEGSFRSFMHVSLVNEGPVTFILSTR
ncbi:MAG: D-aminoacyl-tRNA deacylase [Thermodesulfovibrio sp.]|nr:D-aminoacyl-tRNA deacylase [Thermodesulfovibrio sp.]MDW7997990.1 D-aminoacyl-tRNA deacylase [Thermodesulfovibrio sp.]